jgi:hypothetical protein
LVAGQNAHARAANVVSGTIATLAKFGVDSSRPICKLAVCMFGDRASSSRLLTSSRSLASDSGIHGSMICQEICGLAHSAYNFMTSRLSDVISRVTAGMGRHMEGAVRTTFQPMLFVRWRRYDETPLKLKVNSPAPAAGSGAGQETSIGRQKLLVTEAGWAMCTRKTVGEQTRMLAMMGAQPTVLQCIENNNAACLRQALLQLDLPSDHTVDQAFLRCVDVVMTDACGANLLCERARRHEPLRRHRHVLHLLCDAHKLFAVHTQSFALLKPWDSQLIRLALSVDGSGFNALRREMRSLIAERLVVIPGSRNFS